MPRAKQMLHIDTFSCGDYDKVEKFCFDNGITIINRDRVKMTMCAEMSEETAIRMKEEPDLNEAVVLVGTRPR